MQSSKRLSGMPGFTVVWLGQIVSVLASMMTQFALTIWAFEKTGSATALGLIQVFFITPFLLISPLAGVLVDRHNRKLMMVSDLGAGLATVGILILQAFGVLEIWHLYLAAVINGLGNTFQWPAYSASISTMLPKEQYGRANGMMSLIEAGPGVIAPLIAGALLPVIGLTVILLIPGADISRDRARPVPLDPVHADWHAVFPADQQLRPSHLAGQGRPGFARTGLYIPALDRLAHPTCYSLDRRTAG